MSSSLRPRKPPPGNRAGDEKPPGAGEDKRWGTVDWLVLAGLLLLAVLAWSPVLFSRSHSFGVELDFLRQFYPARYFAAGSIAEGVFPLWNPYVFCGQPFVASYQSAMFYPFNLLMVGFYGLTGLAFPLGAQKAFVVFHFFLAGAFTYLLCRDLRLGRPGSVTAAVAYMFSGYLVAHAGHLNQHSAAAWIPLVFLLFYRCLDRRRISWAVAAGVALGLSILAGHLQPVFYLCLLLLALACFMVILRLAGDASRPSAGFGLLALSLTLLVALGLTAVQLLPTYQMIGLSSREGMAFDIAATYSLPRRQVITLLFPHFYGSSPAGYTGGWAPAMWEMYGYTGAATLALGAVALLRRRRGLPVFLWVVVVLAVILALGPGGFLWTALFRSGLLFNRLRDPARILVIYGFAVALLAGLGVDHLSGCLRDRPRGKEARAAFRVLAGAFAVALVAAAGSVVLMVARGGAGADRLSTVARSLPVPLAALALVAAVVAVARRRVTAARWAGVLIAGVVALDLLVLNVPWVMVRINPDDLWGDAAASGYLARQEGDFRVEVDAHTMYEAMDNGPVYGVEKTSGDDSMVLLGFYRYRELLTPSISPGVQPGLFYEGGLLSPMLDHMNAVYFTSRNQVPAVLSEGRLDLVETLGGVNIYHNRAAMPRAYLYPARVMADDESILGELERTGGRVLESHALITAVPAAGLSDGDVVESVDRGIRIVDRSPHRLVIEAGPGSRGLLIVPDAYYPGWEVLVNGHREEVLKVNYMFRGVLLDGDGAMVEFRFRPRALYIGAALSGATLVVLAALGLFMLIRRRRGGGASHPGAEPERRSTA